MNLIEVKNVSKKYDDFELDNISFELKKRYNNGINR